MLAAHQGMFKEHAGSILSDTKKSAEAWANKKILMEKAEPYLDDFDLREHLDQYPSQLSGGQKQRLAILSQVLCSSHFIILDEPFSGQDPVMKQKACETLIRVSRFDEFETLIIITHDIPNAVWVSDTLLLMGKEKDHNGKFKPGSTVFKPYSLADCGLAWQEEDVCRTKEFKDLVDEIQYNWFRNM